LVLLDQSRNKKLVEQILELTAVLLHLLKWQLGHATSIPQRRQES
jgi:hypothetical protein